MYKSTSSYTKAESFSSVLVTSDINSEGIFSAIVDNKYASIQEEDRAGDEKRAGDGRGRGWEKAEESLWL